MKRGKEVVRMLIWNTETGILLDEYTNCNPTVAQLWDCRETSIRIEIRWFCEVGYEVSR